MSTSDPSLFEIVNGQVVELSKSVYSSFVANALRDELTMYAKANGSGRARSGVLFRLPAPNDPERLRRPSVAFVSFDNWPADKPFQYLGDGWDVVPELACEVISPDDLADDVIDKALEYLRAGVKLVWVVFPKARQIYTYTSPAPRAFGPGDTLDGGDVLPGFRVAVDALFPPVAEPRG